MSVSRDELEASLAELRAAVPDPRLGIYGPNSASWEIGKEGILFLGGGKAALLQLAHPAVAHAVDQHSETRTDPLGRFQRTFQRVFQMVFGDLDKAMRAARRVHAIHTRVQGSIDEDVGSFRRGTAYAANDEAALLWVHATLIETALQVYDLVVRPLRYQERDRYYQESKRFARLFGLSERIMPRDWAAFVDYYRGMLESDVIRVGRPGRELASFLFSAPRFTHRPIFGWLELMTAGLMPERLRTDFGLDFGSAERAMFEASLATLRVIYPRLPSRVRYIPAYVNARRRLAGRSGPDRIGRLLERIALFGLDSRGMPGSGATRARSAG
jgi:uncharacterized protein (DUF2236 family)